MKTFVKKVFCFVRKTACREHGDGFIQKLWKAGNAHLDDVKLQEDYYEDEASKDIWTAMSALRWKTGFCQ